MLKLLVSIAKTGASSITAITLNVLSIKIIAVLLGPPGVGLFSLIRQTAATMAAFGMGGQTALVQGISSKSDLERDTYVRTIFWLFFLGTLFSILLIEVFAPQIAKLLVGTKVSDFTVVIRWIAVPVVLSNMYIYLKGMLNGFRAIGRLAIVEALGPFVMLILVYPACKMVGKGYALAFVGMISSAQLIMVLSSFLIVYRNGWLTPIFQHSHPRIDKESAQHFTRIAGTTLFTGLLGMTAILVVRAMITRKAGLHEAGLFDLAWALSGNYVMLLLSSFGTYYMPTLSGTVDPSERAILIRQVTRISVLIMVPLIVGVVVLKPLLVRLFYSMEFSQSLDLVRWMLIGDYLKVTSWVLAIPALAKLDMRTYFWTEVFWYLGFALLSTLSILVYGQMQGIGVAFIILYLCLTIFYALYVQKSYQSCITLDLVRLWGIGFFIILLASQQCWENTRVNWSDFVLMEGGCFVFILMSLNKAEILDIKVYAKRLLRRGAADFSRKLIDLREMPLVICVGAQKAATTTLDVLMRAHPEVCVSKVKETGFFNTDAKFINGYTWHLEHEYSQEESQTILFEADPDYMFYPIAIDRIYACKPSAKIIVMLRNPVLRAHSQYLMMYYAGYENLQFYEACIEESNRTKTSILRGESNSYIARSLYAPQIEHIVKTFPKNQILFICFEDFIENQQKEFGKILEWLKLAPIELSGVVKERPTLDYNPLRKHLYHPGVARFRKYATAMFGQRAVSIFSLPLLLIAKKTREIPKAPNLSRDIYCKLQKIFEEDVLRTEALTGLDLSVWKTCPSDLTIGQPCKIEVEVSVK